MYQRRRRAKFMPKTKAIRAKVQEAEIKEALENMMKNFLEELQRLPGENKEISWNEGIWQTGYKEA